MWGSRVQTAGSAAAAILRIARVGAINEQAESAESSKDSRLLHLTDYSADGSRGPQPYIFTKWPTSPLACLPGFEGVAQTIAQEVECEQRQR
jgi:hypothetical protein